MYMEVILLEQFRICKNCDFSGVYAIVNTNNNKIYIGSAKNIRKRLESHKSRFLRNKNGAKEMQEDFNNGDNFISFVVAPVKLCSRKGKEGNNLRYFESEAIFRFNSHISNIGYNKNSPCLQLLEFLDIMEAKNHFEKSNFEFLENTERRF